MSDDEKANTTEFPIATEHLRKGMRVTTAEIEAALGVRRGTDGFRLATLRVREYVARRLLDRGEPATVIQDHDEIAILTDEQALAYNVRRFEIETAQRDRCFARLGQTDRAHLSERSRDALDRKLTEFGQRIQADRKARREVRLKPAERATPAALPSPGKPQP